MQCNEIRDYFSDYLKERLAPAAQTVLSRHLRECPSCNADLEEFTDIWVKLGALPPAELYQPMSAEVSARLHSAIEEYKAGYKKESGLEAAGRRRGKPWRPALVVAAAAVLIVLMSVAIIQRTVAPSGAAAVVEAVDGSLYRTWGGQTDSLKLGATIERGEIVRTDDAAGAVLALADGSRLEMRAQSELSLESTDDGLGIRLSNGGVIVNAARQRAGHLYVQTKDVTVSVVGTVFLVNAGEEGSRVAVIEGEVRVQQGATEKQLRPGEQVATSPLMASPPVKEEISWSRNAEAHLALLQQSAAGSRAGAPQNPPDAREAFEVASIRPSAPAPVVPGGRGGGPGGCRGGNPQINPGRFAITCATLNRLVDLAYGIKNCPLSIREGPLAQLDQQIGRPTFVRACVSGGPEWTKLDHFDIQAVIPQGSPTYTRSDLTNGEAPKLQMMIQILLADRFKLTLHREMKEVPVYNLVVEKPGKIKLSDDQTPPGDPPVGINASALPRGVMLNCSGTAIPISALATCLQSGVGRPVIDKTGLKGLFDIPQSGAGPNVEIAPLLLEQLGLKLESAKAPLEVLVVDHAEKPSEN